MNLSVGDRLIGDPRPVFVIAEIGGNHGGRVELAREMIVAAARAKADAVKFQIFRTDRMLAARSQYYDEFKAEELTPENFRVLKEFAEAQGLVFFATPFDLDSAGVLAELEVPLFKLASGDITNLPLLGYLATFQRPIIISTGAADLDEIKAALEFARDAGATDLALMQCTVAYPCPDDQINLRAIATLQETFGLPVGFSDHSLGIDLALAAVALGASFIEKHFTIDQSLPGGDNEMSILPDDLAALVAGARRIKSALGNGRKRVMPVEAPLQSAIRRSLVVAVDVPAGTILGPEHLALKRPGDGVAPAVYFEVIGRRTLVDLRADEPVSADKVTEDD
ncbi:MAG: N-acetylneuraminate synthase family protein [Proteobacteria bacterium]|nr:N-acetylneuraminate synthase family protein [Pseudomonadota bacterium]